MTAAAARLGCVPARGQVRGREAGSCPRPHLRPHPIAPRFHAFQLRPPVEKIGRSAVRFPQSPVLYLRCPFADHSRSPASVRLACACGGGSHDRTPDHPSCLSSRPPNRQSCFCRASHSSQTGRWHSQIVQMTLYLGVSQWRPLQQDLPFKRKSQRLLDDLPHHRGIVLSFLDFSLQKPITCRPM
jgi:hypothetical protein